MNAAVVASAVLLGVFAPTDVQQHLSASEAQLGAPFEWELVLQHPASQRWELLPYSGDLPFEVLGQTRERKDSGSQATTRFVLRLALFALGPQTIPGGTFEVTEGGTVSRWTGPSAQVTGLSVLPADTNASGADLLDIAPPETLWVRSYRLLLWAVAALAGSYLLWRWVRWWRRRPRKAEAVRPPDPIDVRTLAALDALARQDLPAQGKVREFYFRLSEILRAYLAERFRIDALECTTPELLARLPSSAAGLPYNELRTFLEEADLAKFARAALPPSACAAAMQFGQRLVRQTSPQASRSNVPGTPLSAA